MRPLVLLGNSQPMGTTGFLCSQSSVLCSLGQRECDQCGEDYWSNPQKSECVLKEVEFLAYDEALGFTLVILSIFGALLVLAVTTVYVIHRHTPLVMAKGRELSFLIQVSLVITLLSSMLFIGKPYNWSCMACQITLVLGFSLCLSCILGKTISVFSAYRISKSKTQLISIHPLYRKIIVLTSVLVEIGVVAQTVKCLSTMRETRVWSLGWEDPLEKEMAIHSSTIAWKIPCRLQSMGSQRVRHDWATILLL